MGRARALLALTVAALVCAGGASAASGWTEVTIKASDTTPLACAYIVPTGTAPDGGWPGVILFHGLGQSHTDMEAYGSVLAQFGFAALACDARGTGGSGGKFGLDGPNEVQDARDLFTWFAERSDVSDTAIGALGLSLGGGEVWNAAAAGVPFKAMVAAITWTSLGAALNPNGVPKTGLLDQLFRDVPASSWDPSLAQLREDLLGGTVSTATKSAEATRSSRSKLRSLSVPTLLLQGRHDFLFDMDQAIAAYRSLAGPRRLYLGDIGHAPARNPAEEQPTYLAAVVGWFTGYLEGREKPLGSVQLAHDPWDGVTSHYKGLPRTRHDSVTLAGSARVAGGASVRRSVRLTGGPLETFGDGSLTVRYSDSSGAMTMRAMVSVQGDAVPITYGAATVHKGSGVVTIPLSAQAVLLPRGKRIVVTVGGTSAAGVYLRAPGSTTTIEIGRITLDLSLLAKAVSR
ncbi:MAG TPA: CocE/NonD family hydrolase [Gaiellaceae bacterium]|nr:CocE/NonD family hydrolase [Gaiellaceae bacterium]